MEAKITVLYDEGALSDTSYIGAQGSSFVIEADGETTLMGVGHRPRYLENNMYVMDLDADSVTRAVIPDIHKDEWGAIDALLKPRSEPLKVLAPSTVWGEKKKLMGCTGMYVAEENKSKLDREDLPPGWSQISEHLFVGVFGAATFEEAVLIIRAAKGPVVISNRCLSGMKSIFEAVEDRFKKMPVAFIGGIEVGRKNDPLCDAVGSYLKEVGCSDLRFNHCTGPMGVGRLRTVLGLHGLKDFYVGESATFGL